jgi:hypothetical protein
MYHRMNTSESPIRSTRSELPLGPHIKHIEKWRSVKQQARNKRTDACTDIMQDVETKERRINIPGRNLVTPKNDAAQL